MCLLAGHVAGFVGGGTVFLGSHRYRKTGYQDKRRNEVKKSH
jgi:hypothetical protein